MTLPDYNASPDELLLFLDQLQGIYTSADAEWYDLSTWQAVVRSKSEWGRPFNEDDRKRLFEYLNKLVQTGI